MNKIIIIFSVLSILLLSGCTKRNDRDQYIPEALEMCFDECRGYGGRLANNRTIADVSYIHIEECLCSEVANNYEYLNITCFVSYDYEGIAIDSKCSLNGFVNPILDADSCLDASEVDFDCCLANCSNSEEID